MNVPSNMLEPVQLRLVLNLQPEGFELLLEIAECHDLSGIVGCKGRALESLPQNLVARPDALWVESSREELASSLDKSARQRLGRGLDDVPSSDPATAREEPTSCCYMEWIGRQQVELAEHAMFDVEDLVWFRRCQSGSFCYVGLHQIPICGWVLEAAQGGAAASVG